MSSSPTPDFGLLAPLYDELRPADEAWRELLETLVAEGDLAGRRVLDVGCGTGRLTAALAERGIRVWGVDPSPEMLAVAKAKIGRPAALKVARAERLPFRDGWFDRTVFCLVVHLLDRPQAFGEARRVLARGGRAVMASFDPVHFSRYYLNRYFPSVERIDRERFPPEERLRAEFEQAGFGPLRVARLHQELTVDRETVLRRIRGRHISTFQLVGEDELEAGLARAERELPERVDYTSDFLIVVAER